MTPEPLLALGFLNTAAPPGGGPDLWATPSDVLTWLLDSGPAPHGDALAALGPPDLRRLLDDALRLRTALSELVEDWSARRPLVSGMSLLELNRRLEARPRQRLELALGPGGYEIRPRLETESVAELLAPVAEAGALLLAQEDPGRVRRCAATGCRRWFLDTSKNQRRRWCSMAVCGNRSKVAAHHRRTREAGT